MVLFFFNAMTCDFLLFFLVSHCIKSPEISQKITRFQEENLQLLLQLGVELYNSPNLFIILIAQLLQTYLLFPALFLYISF